MDELELIVELELKLELKDLVNFLRPSQAFLGSPWTKSEHTSIRVQMELILS